MDLVSLAFISSTGLWTSQRWRSGTLQPRRAILASGARQRRCTVCRLAFVCCRGEEIAKMQIESATLEASVVVSRRALLQQLALSALALAVRPASGEAATPLAETVRGPAWKQVRLPTDSVLFDIDFSQKDPNHGWLVGTRGLVLETRDGGDTWEPRAFEDIEREEELNYRFSNVSFAGDEAWIIGKPPVMLRTTDGGKNWSRVLLSPKLPGEPILVTALGPDRAEMVTSAGAIYVTDNGGLNWKALVRETIDATLNRTISSGITGASYFTGSIVAVSRDIHGNYVAIPSRGNFFLTWMPGSDFWIPHARSTSRRISAIGFIQNDASKGLWESIRGGGLGFTKSDVNLNTTETIQFDMVDSKSGGYGILDVAFQDDRHVWAAVGGGNIYRSDDGGKTWRRDPLVSRVGANLYKIKFFGKQRGFVLGADGALLKFQPENV
ncbi:hypothetical protein CCYA_CCYA04G1403 [Cyanidiococcus yangmingshanensis]|nr:hypothetical protein CCYA_CCYA04G1403 [Cyanidiococcus yangmingshanensis]